MGRISALGVITIAVYGAWYYAFGVLLDPIIADTGWSEPALTAAYGASILIGGVGSLGGGWVLDRFGSRVTFVGAAIAGIVFFQIAASTTAIGVFVTTAAAGGGLMSALGMYHITQTVAIRISPDATTRAIAVLTIWGAFASAIYVPLTGWIVEPLGWRMSLRLITGSAVLALALGALAIDTAPADDGRGAGVWPGLWRALKEPSVRRFLTAVGLVGIGTSTMLVYQVPAMTAAGLPLAAASFWAGVRGFAQLGGRVPLLPLVDRLGVSTSFRVAISAIALGMIILAYAGTPLVAAVFAVIAGFGVGAMSPLQGMQLNAIFDESGLGTAMGLASLVFLVVGSAGPALAGTIAEAAGSRQLPVILAGVVTAIAAVVTPSPS